MSMSCLILLAHLGLLLSPQIVQAASPQRLSQDEDEILPIAGLLAADVGKMTWGGRYLWVATEGGLARLDPSEKSGKNEEDWVTFNRTHGMARGSISALAASGDTVWIATLIDTVRARRTVNAGQGLSFSVDAGASWETIPNRRIFDPTAPGFARGPEILADNPCWGLALDGSTVIGTFFAGSAVRSRDHGRTWERLLPDGAADIVFGLVDTGSAIFHARADSLEREGAAPEQVRLVRATADSLGAQSLMHRTFSALAYGDTLWIGTSKGIGRSFDGGRTWTNLRVRTDADGSVIPGNIGGNWVVALERQLLADGGAVIWAGTRLTTAGAGEVNSISFSTDNGASWTVTGPTFAWDFAFTDGRVWAGTETGLLASSDQGQTWEAITVEDASFRDQLRGRVAGLETVGKTLWVGADNGLGVTTDEGKTWQIVTGLVKTQTVDTGQILGESGISEKVRSYAAPTPFAPSEGERTRIVYSLENEANVTIRIYDFASRLVTTLLDDVPRAGGQRHAEMWDGMAAGERVANGAYLYRLELTGGKVVFGKVVVLD